ncbi:hypothetical protein VdG2_06984 [Verticillium dahliae VDG2]|nr:hypothetical protein VdG2_06984 [Verticillium dahliae VDG2]
MSIHASDNYRLDWNQACGAIDKPDTLPPTPAEDDEPSIAEALRLRTLRKSRLNGVGFRAQTREDEPSSSAALIPKPQDEETAPDGGITNRFAPQTGLVGELVNKHM